MRVVIPDLAPATTYNLQFRSVSATGEVSEWSRLFSLTTTSDASAPLAPTGLALTSTGTSFTASWNVVTLSADGSNAWDLAGYRLKIESPLSGLSKIITTTDTSYTLTLEENRQIFGSPVGQITVSVAAFDGAGNVSPYSSTVTTTNPAPTQPANFTATANVDSIHLKWDAVSDADLKEYRIYTGTTAGFTPASGNQVWAGGATAATLSNTAYSTDTYYKLASIDVFGIASTYASAGPVRPNSAFVVDSTAPSVPTGLAATLANSTDESYAIATVSWTAVSDPNNDLSEYIIGYRPVGATDWQYAKVDYTNTSTKINGLLPYTNYEFRIRASDFLANLSAWSSTVTATGSSNTNPSQPSTPTVAANTLQIQVTQANTKQAGGAMEGDVVFYEVYGSTTNGFTPAAANMLGTMTVGPAIIGTFYIPASNSSGSTQTWYVKTIAVDRGGLKSTASAQGVSTPGLIATSNISDLAVTSAKINDLAANKITAGTGIINDLSVKAKLTLGDASTVGAIESYGYAAGTTGFHFDKNLLEINQGSIAAAALKIQDSNNMIRAEYAGMEAGSQFYDARTVREYAFVAVDTSVKRFGKQSLKQTWFTGAAGSRSRVWYTDDINNYNIDVDPSTTYIVSAWTRTVSTPAMNYKLQVRESTGTDVDIVSVTHDTTGSWMRYSGTITTGPSTYQIMVGTSFDASLGNADVWIDGIQVERKQGALNTPSVWKPPGFTTIDGAVIRTGEIRSNATVIVDDTSQPTWSIDMEGDAQFGNALVRGKMIVGLADEPPINRAPWNGDAETNLGVAGYNLYSSGATTPTLVRTTTAGEVIAGTASYKMTAAAGTKNALGLYFDTQDFLTDAELTVDLYVKSDAAGDIVVDFHDGTSTVIQSNVAMTAMPANTLTRVTTTMTVPEALTVRRIYIYQSGTITTTSLIMDNITLQSAKEAGQSFIASGNYTQGSTGWKINSAGDVEFNSGVFRGTLGADSVTAEALASNLVIASTIKTSETGKRIEFNADAFRLYDSSNNTLINFSTDDAVPASFSGDLTANSLVVSGNLAIRGTSNELSQGSELYLSSGITAPTLAPTISFGWPAINTRDSRGFAWAERYGLVKSGSYFYMAETNNTSLGLRGTINRYDATTGAKDLNFGVVTTLSNAQGGLTLLGNTMWVLGQGTSNYWYVEGYDITTWAKVATRWQWSTASQKPAIGNDGTNIVIASDNYSSASGKLSWARYTTAGVYVTSTRITTATGLTAGCAGIYWGSADFGGTVVMVAFRQSAGFYGYTTAGVRASQYDFPTANSYYPSGTWWDGSNFWMNHSSAGVIHQYSAIKWTTETSKWWASETWYDPDATGGTHETIQGNRTSFTMKKRAFLNVTSPALPVRPSPTTTDDATQGRIYIGRGTNDPGRAQMEYAATVTDASRTAVIGTISLPAVGSNATNPPPSFSNFPAGIPGALKSTNNAFTVKGDGTGTWGGINYISGGAGMLADASGTMGWIYTAMTGSSATTSFATDQPYPGGPSIVFTAPASGRGFIHAHTYTKATTTGIYSEVSVQVRTGSVVGSGTIMGTAPVHTNYGTDWTRGSATVPFDGLTPGSQYNIQFVFRSASAGTNANISTSRLVWQPTW